MLMHVCLRFCSGLVYIRNTCTCISLLIVVDNEESSKIVSVGIDQLLKGGKLEKLKDGPVYWVDTADSQPCMGIYCFSCYVDTEVSWKIVPFRTAS